MCAAKDAITKNFKKQLKTNVALSFASSSWNWWWPRSGKNSAHGCDNDAVTIYQSMSFPDIGHFSNCDTAAHGSLIVLWPGIEPPRLHVHNIQPLKVRCAIWPRAWLTLVGDNIHWICHFHLGSPLFPPDRQARGDTGARGGLIIIQVWPGCTSILYNLSKAWLSKCGLVLCALALGREVPRWPESGAHGARGARWLDGSDTEAVSPPACLHVTRYFSAHSHCDDENISELTKVMIKQTCMFDMYL